MVLLVVFLVICSGLHSSIKPFSFNVSDVDVYDLTSRLIKSRFPVSDDAASWKHGMSVSHARQLQQAWLAHNFSAFAQKVSANSFQASIGDSKLHFVLKRAKNPKSKRQPALLLLHGWPGSFLEFLPALDILKNFDVVVPSLPGFGLSLVLSPKSPSLDVMAKQMVQLMEMLEMDSYVVQGGDLGAPLATKICDGDQKHCLGQVGTKWHVFFFFFLT